MNSQSAQDILDQLDTEQDSKFKWRKEMIANLRNKEQKEVKK